MGADRDDIRSQAADGEGMPIAIREQVPPPMRANGALHEWAERIAVPTFDFVAIPIEAMMDALAGRRPPPRPNGSRTA